MENTCFRAILDETINELAALKPLAFYEQKVFSDGAISQVGSYNSGDGDVKVGEEPNCLVLPSYERLVNYRKYISDQLDITDITKLDQRIHKQAGRYKSKCKSLLTEIDTYCKQHQKNIPGTTEADTIKMSSDIDKVLEVLIQTAQELENGNSMYLKNLVGKELALQNVLKEKLARFHKTQEMLGNIDQEIASAYLIKKEKLRQQEVYLSALACFLGEQENNLAKEKSYAKRSCDAAIARLGSFSSDFLLILMKFASYFVSSLSRTSF